jgi:hypothetical protein
MIIEEALVAIAEILEGSSLSNTQETILRHIWEGCSYQEIAKRLGYNEGYTRSVGSKLFQKIADTLGEKVSKQNIQFVLRRYVKRHSSYIRRVPNRFVPSSANVLFSTQMDASNQDGLNQDAPNQDWGEAIDVSTFYGRGVELATLQEWIVGDRCRLVGLQGKSGIGKTALSVKLAQRVQPEFDYVMWRSLRYMPSLPDLLTRLIGFLPKHNSESEPLPDAVGDRISYFIRQLQKSRCLIVLSHFQAVLEPNPPMRYRKDFEDYGELLRRIGETQHQSCVVVVSLQKPREIAILQGDRLPVRSLSVTGLDSFACQKILRAKGVQGAPKDLSRLIVDCQGNPLELKLAASAIQDSCAGSVAAYLRSLPMELHA